VVATDRISAFDVVMPDAVPGKGRILTALSVWWLRWLEGRGLGRTHLLSDDVGEVPESALEGSGLTRERLAGRVMIARKCRVIPIECVARGYLEGSGWREYRHGGSVCGVRLAEGLKQCDRLEEPIFTPATKEEGGRHDENITFEEASARVGEGLMRTLRERTLGMYRAASAHAASRGIIIADTKFEFGLEVDASGRVVSEDPMVVDEVLTPDSSRFWPADKYQPGRAQPSFDKQFLREYLETLVADGSWSKEPPGPKLPGYVVSATLAKYTEALERLTG
jgi:phosphoribosylaminoimidazole-succinocarboxamide synthase